MDTEGAIVLNLVCLLAIAALYYFIKQYKSLNSNEQKRKLINKILLFALVLVIVPASTYLLFT